MSPCPSQAYGGIGNILLAYLIISTNIQSIVVEYEISYGSIFKEFVEI